MVESWIAPLDSGDPERAWDLFVERYRRLIFGAIRHYTAEPDDVMDVFAHVCAAFRENDFARLRRCAARWEPTRPRLRGRSEAPATPAAHLPVRVSRPALAHRGLRITVVPRWRETLVR